MLQFPCGWALVVRQHNMGIFITSRQIPELRHLSDEDVRAVEQHCLGPHFRRGIWLCVIIAASLGDLGFWVGGQLGDGAMGSRIICICFAEALASVVYVHTICFLARPAIREYLELQRHEHDTTVT
jgi:hypothetical protein